MSSAPRSPSDDDTSNNARADSRSERADELTYTQSLDPSDKHAAPVEGYEILEVVGRGGMGVVYKARDRKLKRLVALKMILAGKHAGADDLNRFRNEAETVARLQHPNIVQIFAVGDQASNPYLVLEFIEGVSLGRFTKGEPQSPHLSAELIEILALAVHYAHEQGIIHRDLKPGNILLVQQALSSDSSSAIQSGLGLSHSRGSVSGQSSSSRGMTTGGLIPKITDFGLAKQLDADDAHTQTGQVVGTAKYMSPEQAEGRIRELGPLSDVYALGVILYELLTGRPPFQGATSIETLQMVRHDEPVPPSRFQSRVPRDLETICLKCLEKDPARRYQTAAVLAAELRRFLIGEPIVARPVSRGERAVKWIKRRPVIAALTLAIVLVFMVGSAGVFYQWRQAVRARDDALEQRTTALELVREKESLIGEKETLAEQEQRARQLAEEQRKEAERRRLEAETESARAERLAEAERNARLDVERQLRIANALRLAAQASTLREQDPPLSLLLAVEAVRLEVPDQGVLPLAREALIESVASSGGTRLPGGGDAGVLDVNLSSDGRWVIASTFDSAVQICDLHSPTFADRTFGSHRGRVNAVAMTSDNRWAVSAGLDATVRVWDLASGDPETDHFVLLGHRADVTDVAVSPDDHWLASVGRDGLVHVWDLTDDKLAESIALLDDRKAPLMHVDFSPDGRWLAIGGDDAKALLWDISTGDWRNQDPVTLDNAGARIQTLTFSPDSRWLATGGATLRLWDLAAENTSAPLKLPISKQNVVATAFGPTSKLLVTARPDGFVTVWDLPAPLNTTTEEGATRLAQPQRRFEFRAHSEVINQVGVSQNGRWLVTASQDRTVRAWDLQSEAPVETNRVFRGHARSVTDVAISPDSRWVVSGSEDNAVRVWLLAGRNPAPSPVIFPTHDGPVEFARVTENGHRLITVGPDEARVWDLPAQDPAAEPAHLHGHRRRVEVAALSNDGRWLATGGWDRAICIWDLSSDELTTPVAIVREAGNPVRALAFSADSRWLASGGGSNKARLFDLRSDDITTPVAVLEHRSPVHRVAFPPGDRWLLTGSQARAKQLWELKALPDASSLNLKGFESWTHPVAFSSASSLLAGTRSGGGIVVWDLAADNPAKPKWAWKGHEEPVSTIEISPDGRYLVSASTDRTARLWSLTEDDPALQPVVLRGHTDGVNRVAFSPDGKQLATGSLDGTTRLWDLNASSVSKSSVVLRGHRGGIATLSFSPDGQRLVTGGQDGSTRLWNLDLQTLVEHALGVAGRELTPEERAQYQIDRQGSVE